MMNIPVQMNNKIVVVEFTGRVESHTLPTLQQQLEPALNATPPYIVVDLSNVTFIDSSGLVLFVQNMRRCRENGGDLYLCCPQQPVRMVLELTRLDKALEIFPTQADARAAFAQLEPG